MKYDCQRDEEKRILKILDESEKERQRKFRGPRVQFLIMVAMILALMSLAACPAHSEESIDGYTVTQYVDAIYQAEGGKKASFPYGIRSIKCSTETECRKICRNTVRNNIKRFRDYGHKDFPQYIDFLQSRYCPTTGNGLSTAEKRLNGNWKKNVVFYLQKQKTE